MQILLVIYKKSSGYVFLINGSAVTWKTQRQSSVTCSTAEAEYFAASEACKEAIWITQLLVEIGVCVKPVDLCVDNQSAVKLIKNPVFHHRSKHIDFRYHYVRERYSNKEIDVKFI